MLFGKSFLSLFPIGRFLLFLRESSLETSKLLFGFAIVPGVLDRSAIRSGEIGFEPDINPQVFARRDVFDFALGIHTELAVVAICASDDPNTFDVLHGKCVDALIGIANQFETPNPTAIGEGDVPSIGFQFPSRGFVLDAPVVALKPGIALLAGFLVFAVVIEARNSKPRTISRRLTGLRVELSRKGGLFGKDCTIGLQVVFGGTTLVHPQAQRLVADELDNFADIDVKRTEQVLTNLLGNAVKYSPQGGPITLTITQDTATRAVQISVQDRGIGIPGHQQAQIFGRFTRADNALAWGISGTGLGLYLCRELVERQGGRLWFESEEGVGSTFFVTLPLASSEQKKEASSTGDE